MHWRESGAGPAGNSVPRICGAVPEAEVDGSADASIKLTRQGYPTRTIGCSSVCNCLDVAPGGMICCSGHLDGVVRVWDLRTGRSLHEIRGGSFGSMVSTRFSRGRGHKSSAGGGASLLLTVSRDNAVRTFDSLTWEPRATLRDDAFSAGANCTQGALSPDDCFAAVGGAMGSIFIWDTTSSNAMCWTSTRQSSPVAAGGKMGGKLTADQRGYVVAWG